MIRRASHHDADALATLINAVIALPHITFRSAPRSPQEIADMLEQPVWVAEIDGAVVGYASYSPFRGSDGYRHTAEHAIALDPTVHGRGLGRALMAALETEAAANGIRTLVAGVSGSNPAGQAFHAALGFTTAGTLPTVGHKAGAWHDLIFMTKALPVPNADHQPEPEA